MVATLSPEILLSPFSHKVLGPCDCTALLPEAMFSFSVISLTVQELSYLVQRVTSVESCRAAGVSPSSLSAGLCPSEVNRSGHLSVHQFPCLEHGPVQTSAGMNELGHQAHPEPWPQLPDTGHILSSLPGDWFVSLALLHLKLSYSYRDLAQSHG